MASGSEQIKLLREILEREHIIIPSDAGEDYCLEQGRRVAPLLFPKAGEMPLPFYAGSLHRIHPNVAYVMQMHALISVLPPKRLKMMMARS